MTRQSPAMHVSVVKSKQGSKTYSAVLVRHSYRDHNGKSQKHTVANITHLPDHVIELVRAALKGEPMVNANETFDIVKVLSHGAVEAVMRTFRQLDFASVISSQRSRNRDLVMAMIAARIIRPHTKLATVRWWRDTTLPRHFDIADAEVDELYAAMDWLVSRQMVIQGKLVRRHIEPGALALFDLSSTWLEGSCCPLAQYGYSRDGKKGRLQVNFGLLCDRQGRPLSVTVGRSSLRDSETLLPQVDLLRRRFGIERLAVVGDRGMATQVNIDALRRLGGVDWIGDLKSATIRKLVRDGGIPLSRFDDVNLFEVLHPDYPDERLIACRNPRLAEKRKQVREQLLSATERKLAPIVESVAAGRLSGADRIGLKVGSVINVKKMRKHFIVDIAAHSLSYRRNPTSIAAEAALDGVYVIRTSLDEHTMTGAECVRNYKRLCQVERAFRNIKTVSLQVRPVHHRTAPRVRAHIFLCTLACYVEWHMRQAWQQLLFSDPHLDELREQRDVVLTAGRSAEANRKVASARLEDGSTAYCFRTLIEHLETMTVNLCHISGRGHDSMPFELESLPNAKQQVALDLLKNISYPARRKRL